MPDASQSTANPATDLLRRSLANGRLGHAYLFVGGTIESLEAHATELARTLNCQSPPAVGETGIPLEACGECIPCRKVDSGNFPDLDFVRPEKKSRIISIEQIRYLTRKISLKPTEGRYKVAIITGADRMPGPTFNAFLKTLEEPPERTVFVLLTTHPDQLGETVRSRCMRVNFGGGADVQLEANDAAWLKSFVGMSAEADAGLMGRYRLLGNLMEHLSAKRDSIEEIQEEASPLNRHDDLEPVLREKLKEELNAAIEAEYRRQRGQFLAGLQWWLRDVWLAALRQGRELLHFQEWADTSEAVGQRLTPGQALENLQSIEATQRLLETTNVQEALALEVGLLKLKF
ncbi:MAG: DNA polymerase III subunit [Pedosphaera sp.]|nr:DNA polymerase III subunit [Pedosphaera sp.]